MWGILPISSSILAMFLVLIPEKRWHAQRVVQPAPAHENLVLGRLIS
jgi:hypothetical protein